MADPLSTTDLMLLVHQSQAEPVTAPTPPAEQDSDAELLQVHVVVDADGRLTDVQPVDYTRPYHM